MNSRKHLVIYIFPVIVACSCNFEPGFVKTAPYLEKNGTSVQLFVDDKPFLILGGELHNSSSSSLEYMKDIWPLLRESGMNTVLAGVEWALVEPEEGTFDFSLVDGLIKDARVNGLHLVLLWFGSWKNGQSHYVPGWIKVDYSRFKRVRTSDGKHLEILSPFCKESLEADANAFSHLLKHIKETDSLRHTVIMIQVENEVGVLETSRDFSDAAIKEFNSPVPPELTDYLSENREKLLPETRMIWSLNGYRTSGTWRNIFGNSLKTDEFFMAWNYARYVDYCAKKAKEAYNIPMYVNAWIIQPGDKKPGDYPCGGPQAHLLDIWRAGSPHINLYCPDIYLPDFAGICKIYTRSDNTLFIPESRSGEQGAGQLFYALGRHKAIGYSPFGFENRVKDFENGAIPRAYKLLSGMTPLILEAQSRDRINGVLLKKDIHPEEEIRLGNYNILAGLLKSRYSDTIPSLGYGIFIQTDTNEYVISGHDIQVSFTPATPGPAIAAIEWVDEGSFADGEWIPRRRLNGDAIMLDYDLAKMIHENRTGTGLRFFGNDRNIQRVRLYRFE